jgi:hypothetical protein
MSLAVEHGFHSRLPHTSASVSIRQHTSAYVSIHRHMSADGFHSRLRRGAQLRVSICTFVLVKQVL